MHQLFYKSIESGYAGKYRDIDVLISGSYILVLAHRLSTIMVADRLVGMDHGKIMQIGRHEQLITQEGFYRELVSSQFEQKKI
ncbi:hypothetical protein [Desulfosporosinus sp. BICA1-9]|uniref:hypothetical protein n=1 Tax=Desulfosporosinus sp. BICA1-9 TaxID=1531958 RepID=UPI00054BA014|nr:hypothetical protein [Desulfosporosinus sp. BICA1-9]KJS48613.1 MAG: hypothetical protein VR66_13050 [Peptococcaceae bacterium BRH_c23]KJS81512.1 MAG: hypothetical protein JL57_26445 [Desulfosporosinus sp. BICA1-9]HBW35207.1 hypothetical protein [Desulfosporosinus sp.]